MNTTSEPTPLRRFSDIKHAIYINLDSRTDRRASFESHFVTLHRSYPNDYTFFPITRFSAIKHAWGAVGCSKSHIECIRFAKQKGWDHVLIMEDDALVKHPELLVKQVNTFLATFQDNWDVVLFSGNNYPPFKIEAPYCIKIESCQTTGCYLICSRYYDTLLRNFEEGVAQLETDLGNEKTDLGNEKIYALYGCDQYWKKLQRTDLWYLITPMCVIQRPGYSNIANEFVDYEKLMLDSVKNSRER